jgi:hypothetical protein
MSEPKIAAAITHVDEITLDLCLEALEKQTVSLCSIKVISGVRPAFNAFNMALDHAFDQKADILIHVVVDCILRPYAARQLISKLDRRTYVVTALGFDILNGPNSPIGALAYNMNIIGDRFRFRDVFKMDLDFCQRIEEETGHVRTKASKGRQIGYHHPIWTAREMYQKVRYDAPKYRQKVVIKYLMVFDEFMKRNPDNKVAQIALLGLKRGASEPHNLGSPVRNSFEQEWADLRSLIDLDGSEFLVYHEDWIPVAQKLLNSSQPIVAMEPGSGLEDADLSDKKRWRKADQKAARKARHKVPAIKLLERAIVRRIPFRTQIKRRLKYPRRTATSPAIATVAPEPAMLRYGAVNNGRSGWQERWDRTHISNRVLLVAPKDFAGSMFKWADAINRYTDFAARLVSFEYHQYDYPVDLVVPQCNDERFRNVLTLADEAGFLHLKDEHSWFVNKPFTNRKLIETLFFGEEFRSKPKIFTHYGRYARKFQADHKYIEKVQQFDGRVAMTPDINYPWFGGRFILQTIDVVNLPFSWEDSNIFAHSPSSPAKKATYLFEETLLHLAKHEPELCSKWSFDLIHGVSFAECIRRKQKASIFFDQAGRQRVADLGIDDVIGWYGNSAIEAMAYGIPTMAHLSAQSFEQAAAAGVDLSGIPVINIERTRKSMLEAFLAYAKGSPEERLDLARRTRDFTVNWHGYEPCAKALVDLYIEIAGDRASGKEARLAHLSTAL